MNRNVSVYRKSFSMVNFIKKDLVKLILFFALLNLAACASSMIGRVLPEGNYPNFSNGKSGYHYIPFDRGVAELEYDWNIDYEENALTLKGSYEILSKQWEIIKKSPLKNFKLTIEAYFLNDNYEVVGVEYIFIILDKDKDFEEEQKIEKTFPYKQEYKYVTYKLSYEGYY